MNQTSRSDWLASMWGKYESGTLTREDCRCILNALEEAKGVERGLLDTIGQLRRECDCWFCRLLNRLEEGRP